jgi:hypothetical protein
MDLKFSKAKRELIKEIEISEDESLITRYLAEMRAIREQKGVKVEPMTPESYRLAVLKGLESADAGRVVSFEKAFSRFGLDGEK